MKFDGIFVDFLRQEFSNWFFCLQKSFNFQVGKCHFGSIASSFQVYLSNFENGNEILELGKHPFVASSPNAVCL